MPNDNDQVYCNGCGQEYNDCLCNDYACGDCGLNLYSECACNHPHPYELDSEGNQEYEYLYERDDDPHYDTLNNESDLWHEM